MFNANKCSINANEAIHFNITGLVRICIQIHNAIIWAVGLAKNLYDWKTTFSAYAYSYIVNIIIHIHNKLIRSHAFYLQNEPWTDSHPNIARVLVCCMCSINVYTNAPFFPSTLWKLINVIPMLRAIHSDACLCLINERSHPWRMWQPVMHWTSVK